MTKVWGHIAESLRRHGHAALVSVIATEGSAPRDAGAMMVITPDGFHGTIGGGTLEWRALAEAQAMMTGAPRQHIVKHILGPDLGQCCGGTVELATETFTAASLHEVQNLESREIGGAFALTRVIAGRAVRQQFGELQRPVMIFGAGHVGRALVLALAPLPVRVVWHDPRPGAFPVAIPRNVECHAADVEPLIAAAAAGTLAFVMTHSHALDLAVVDQALRNPAFAHVGLIGSATKRARFEHRLAAAGVPPRRIEGLICPIGVPGVASKLPAAIAAATAAQILVLDASLRLATGADLPQKPEVAAMGAGR